MPNINDYGLPFTSEDGDRKYSALEWREYFSRLIHNGLIQNAANECQVKPQAVPNKTVYVDTGVVFINGAMRVLDAPVTLAVAENTSGNPRIDRVVARLNEASRTIELAVKQGTPAGSPVAPGLTRTEGVYELGLADITLANGYSTITAAEITDQRWDVSLCGASSMTIGVIPPSGLEAETVTLSVEASAMYGVLDVDAAIKKIKNPLAMLNKKVYVSDTPVKSYKVPEGVTNIYVYGCAAGGDCYAGAYVLGKKIPVTPGETLTVTVGTGNSIISRGGTPILTLIAASISESATNSLFGFPMGIAGQDGIGNGTGSPGPGNGGGASGFGAGGGSATVFSGFNCRGGYGGAFGFGGGGPGRWATGEGKPGATTLGLPNTTKIPIDHCEFIHEILAELDYGTAGNGANPGGTTGTPGYGKYAGAAGSAAGISGQGSQGLIIICY